MPTENGPAGENFAGQAGWRGLRLGLPDPREPEESHLSRLVSLDDLRARDYNLSPGVYVPLGTDAEVISVEEALTLSAEALGEERVSHEAAVATLERFGVDLGKLALISDGSGLSTTETELGVLPAGWTIERIGELFELQQGKALSARTRVGANQLPFLRTSNVLWGGLDLSAIDTMHFTSEETEKYALRAGDLLVCEGGEIGRAAMWQGELETCCYQNHIHRLRPRREDVVPAFYMYWLQLSIRVFGFYIGEGNRTTIANLSKSRLSSFRVPVPKPDEQKGIAEALNAVSANIVSRKEEIRASTVLFDALLHELLTGRRGLES